MSNSHPREVLPELIITGGLVMIGSLTVPTVLPPLALAVASTALTKAGAIGENWLASMAEQQFHHWRENRFNLRDLLSQDLSTALCEAFKNAIHQLEEDWKKTGRYSYLSRKDPEAVRLTLVPLEELQHHAQQFFKQPDHHLATVLQRSEVLALLNQDEIKIRKFWIDRLNDYFHGYDEQFVAFIAERLSDEWIARFEDILRSERGNRAWRAIQRLWQSSLMNIVSQIQQQTAEIQAIAGWLKQWGQQLENGLIERDRFGEEILRSVLEPIHERLAKLQIKLDQIENKLDEDLEIGKETGANVRELLNRVPSIEAPPEYAREFDSLIDNYHQNFIGRSAELDKLIKFAGQETPGYLFVEAPLGYGKSALIAQVIYRHQTHQWNGPKPDLLYFFVQKQSLYAKPRTLLQSLHDQLLKLFHNPPREIFDLTALTLYFQRLWSQALEKARQDRPLLLLIDGLDEMIWEENIVGDFLPSKLGNYTHVIVSARPGLNFQQQTPEYHPFSQSQKYHLLPFSELEIKELLEQLGASANLGTDLAPRIWIVTNGEPLYARHICEDVIKYGESILARLEQDPPSGVKEYFRREAGHLVSLAGHGASQQIIGLLINLFGRITLEEISEILALSQWTVEDALDPIKRFLRGETEIEFERKELNEVIKKKFSRHEQENLQQRLLAWCEEYENKGWSEETPPYILNYYANHLEKTARVNNLYRLVENDLWTEVKLSPAWLDSLVKDLQIASKTAVNTFKSKEQVAAWAQSMGYQLRRGLIEELVSRLSDDAVLFLAKLGNVDKALSLARRTRRNRFSLIHDIVKIFEAEPERHEEAIKIYLEMASLADEGKVLSQCQNRMFVAQKILSKFPASFSNKAQDLINEATRREERIPISQRSQYRLEYVLPTLALNNNLGEAEKQAKRLPPFQRAQALRYISLVLPNDHPAKTRLVKKALSTLKRLAESPEVTQERMRIIVTLLPLISNEKQKVTLLKSLEAAGNHLQSLEEPEHYDWTQYWTIRRVAKINLDWAKRIMVESSWIGAFNAWSEVVPEIAKLDYEEALYLLDNRYTNYALYSIVLVDVIKVVSVEHRNVEQAQALIEKYEERLKNDLPEAYVALAEGYLAQGKKFKAQEIFDKHVFSIRGGGSEQKNSELQLAILQQAAQFLNFEVIHERLMNFPRFPVHHNSEGSIAKGILGRMAANENKLNLIEKHHLGSNAEVQAVYYLAGSGNVQVAREYWDKWQLRWSQHKSTQHLNAYIEVAEVKQDPTKLTAFLQHFDNYKKTHKHLCNHIVQLPKALGQLVTSNRIKAKKAKAIIEETYSLLIDWQCSDKQEFSQCLCNHRDNLLGQLIGIMARLDPPRAEQMVNSPQLQPLAAYVLSHCVIYAEDRETIEILVSRIIEVYSETIQDPLERASSLINLATLLPDEMTDQISHLINLAEPLLEESRKSPSVNVSVARGQAFLKPVTGVGQFEYVLKALNATRSFLRLEDKLKVLSDLGGKALNWSADERKILLNRMWETAAQSSYLDVQAIIVCSIPIVNSLEPQDARGFWDLYQYIKWAQELPDLVTALEVNQ